MERHETGSLLPGVGRCGRREGEGGLAGRDERVPRAQHRLPSQTVGGPCADPDPRDGRGPRPADRASRRAAVLADQRADGRLDADQRTVRRPCIRKADARDRERSRLLLPDRTGRTPPRTRRASPPVRSDRIAEGHVQTARTDRGTHARRPAITVREEARDLSAHGFAIHHA